MALGTPRYFLATALEIAAKAIEENDFDRLAHAISGTDGRYHHATFTKPHAMRPLLAIAAHLAKSDKHLATVERISRFVAERVHGGDDWKDKGLERQAVNLWSETMRRIAADKTVTHEKLRAAQTFPNSALQEAAVTLWAEDIKAWLMPEEQRFDLLVDRVDRGQRFTVYRQHFFKLLRDTVDGIMEPSVAAEKTRVAALDFRISGSFPGWFTEFVSHLWLDSVGKLDRRSADKEIQLVLDDEKIDAFHPIKQAAIARKRGEQHVTEAMEWMDACAASDQWAADLRLQFPNPQDRFQALASQKIPSPVLPQHKKFFDVMAITLSAIPADEAIKAVRGFASQIVGDDHRDGFIVAALWKENVARLPYDERLREVAAVSEDKKLSAKQPLRIFADSELKHLKADHADNAIRCTDAFNARFSSALDRLVA